MPLPVEIYSPFNIKQRQSHYTFKNEEVGELVERLRHGGPPSLRDVQLAGDHHVIGAVFGGQEEDAVRVGLVVQEGDATLAQVVGVVLHFDHQVWRTKVVGK